MVDSDSSNVDIITDPTGIVLNIYSDRHPSYYTSFDDMVVVMDSYNKGINSTIVASKIQAMAYVIPGFTMSNTFIPDLPEEAFPALLEEVKSRASVKLRQAPDAKSEQESRRQQRWLSRHDWVVNGGIKRPDYGRKGKK